MKKVFEPVTKSLQNTSQDITKTIMENSNNNSKALETSNNKLPNLLNDRGILATHKMSSLSKFTEPEKTSQFKLVKDSSSNRVNKLLLHNSKPTTLHDNLLPFRDTGKELELK